MLVADLTQKPESTQFRPDCSERAHWEFSKLGSSQISWDCCSAAKWCPTLWPHGLQHTRLPCPSLSPGFWSDWCPLAPWCHPTISSSVTSFFSCPQSFLASRSFLMNHLFTSGGSVYCRKSSEFKWIIYASAALGRVQGTLIMQCLFEIFYYNTRLLPKNLNSRKKASIAQVQHSGQVIFQIGFLANYIISFNTSPVTL